MVETEFTATYQGPALTDGLMPVRDLAPALLALGELYAEASKIVYPDRDPVALNIQATRQGSFAIQMILTAGTWTQVMDLLNSDEATALATLQSLVIGGGTVGVGIIKALKWLKGRPVAKKEQIEPGTVRLTTVDAASIEVRVEVVQLLESREVREKARDVVAPLYKDGIEGLKFTDEDGTETVRVSAAEAGHFEVPVDDDITLDDYTEARTLGIVSPAFEDGKRWRLTQGDHSFTAVIADEDFIQRVEGGEIAFRAGDMLRCSLHTVQRQRKDGSLWLERTVEEVLEHIPRQDQLDLSPPAPDGEQEPREPPPE